MDWTDLLVMFVFWFMVEILHTMVMRDLRRDLQRERNTRRRVERDLEENQIELHNILMAIGKRIPPPPQAHDDEVGS